MARRLKGLGRSLARHPGYAFLVLWGAQYGILSSTPITVSDDFDGRDIRVVGPDTTVIAALGANPVPLAFSEIFLGLQSGEISAMEITAEGAVASKYFELATDFTATNHRIFTELLIMNGSRFDALDIEVRNCLKDTADAAAQFGRSVTVASEHEALTALSELGVELHRISDRPIMFDRVSKVRDDFVSELGGEYLYQLIASAAGTCPMWCSAETCDDEECEMCRICE
ncbi:MAG: TRAP transporter substrate-binding protein DctP [Roseovarius pacificus]|nr:TRAP transporter substrate-binding protein DctP [Roseovarius pacificus]